MTEKHSLIDAKKYMHEAGLSQLDSDLLIMYATGTDRIKIHTEPELLVSDEDWAKLIEYVEQAKENKPMQYITHSSEFMSIEFYVDESVLVPRPDTETAVEFAIDIINKNKFNHVLDLCTGSGCIAISLKKYCSTINITATDISIKALDIARKNDKNKSVHFMKSDLFDKIDGVYDLIISNPPYINKDEMMALENNVKLYEPHLALYGGEDGLEFYHKIITQAVTYLNQNGMLILEIGYSQKEDVIEIFRKNGYHGIDCMQDYSGMNRVVYGTK